jgi:hypothetical protein
MKSNNPVRLKESWVLCFLLGLIMLNYPFIEIFNKPALLFGIPILVLYLMIGWPISIFVIFLFTRHIGDEKSDPGSAADEEPE